MRNTIGIPQRLQVPEQLAKRTLTAIFYADVADYSRHTGLDEEGTHNRVMSMLDNVSQKISASGGTVLRYAGDAILATFPSVVQSVTTSIDIQEGIAIDNASLTEETKVQIRIGINLGDVIEDRGEVFGDGVNLVARLEAAANPGGICISSAVWEQCQDKISATFNDAGEQRFKNIARPVRIFHWQPGGSRSGIDSPGGDDMYTGKSTIAVLPFDNMSGDPEQEYFSDGITEDIITELSRFPSLFVIARNSSFAFKGQAIDITEIGKKLGVQYVVEGSVRKAGDRIRITAQLIEASTGSHLWADRYDRNLDDIFAVQDEVASKIVTMVPGHIDIANRVHSGRKPTRDLKAYDLVLRAEKILYQNYGSPEGEHLLKQALEIDPNYARAHSGIAFYYIYSVFAHGLNIDEVAESARKHAEIALKLDPGDPVIHAALASAYGLLGEHEIARHHCDRSIALNPNEFYVMGLAVETKAYLGEYQEALKWGDRARLSDPYSADAFRESFFDAHYIGGEYQLALDQLVGWNDYPPHILLARAAALAQLDRIDEARETVELLAKTRPEKWNLGEVMRAYERMCANPEHGERWLEGFRKAGLDI
jgi:TolB-like protein